MKAERKRRQSEYQGEGAEMDGLDSTCRSEPPGHTGMFYACICGVIQERNASSWAREGEALGSRAVQQCAAHP